MESNNTIVWENIKAYDPKIIKERSNAISDCTRGALPLYGLCKRKIEDLATKYDVPMYEIVSLYNNIKTQQNIDYGKYNETNKNKIAKTFESIIDEIDHNDDPKINITKIRSFIKHIRSSFSFVYKIMVSSPKYNTIPDYCIEYIEKLRKVCKNSINDQRTNAELFEQKLVDYLKSLKVTDFRTEKEIRRDQDLTITPDILFNEPIIIEINGEKHKVKWIDAKNSTLTDSPFILKSIYKQADKYNKAFGSGAMVFHYGFDTSININTLVLDGSNI